MRWPNIDRCLGLHQSVDVIYVVDGYDALLWEDDGNFTIAEGHGDDVESAMNALDAALSDWERDGRSVVRIRR